MTFTSRPHIQQSFDHIVSSASFRAFQRRLIKKQPSQHHAKNFFYLILLLQTLLCSLVCFFFLFFNLFFSFLTFFFSFFMPFSLIFSTLTIPLSFAIFLPLLSSPSQAIAKTLCVVCLATTVLARLAVERASLKNNNKND